MNYLIYVYAFIFVCFFSWGMYKIIGNKNKQSAEIKKFLHDNPDVIRVYTSKRSAVGSVVGETLRVFYNLFIEKVNDEHPVRFNEKLGSYYGVYIKPGMNTITVKAFSHQKKRASSRSYGPVKLTLDAKIGKEYIITFVNKEFEINEI